MPEPVRGRVSSWHATHCVGCAVCQPDEGRVLTPCRCRPRPDGDAPAEPDRDCPIHGEDAGRVLTAEDATGNGIAAVWRVPPMTSGGTVELDSLNVCTEPEDDDA